MVPVRERVLPVITVRRRSMFRNPWFTLVLGLMVGLVLGYVFAEQQPIPPAKAVRLGLNSPAGQGEALPEGHPPVEGQTAAASQQLRQQVSEIEGLLAANPDDPKLLAAMGNVYFDAGRWNEARTWYEQSLDVSPDDVDVLTDLAVSLRNLQQPQRTIELLDRAIALDPDHWQAWYNKVVVYQFDLHEHDLAADSLRRLQELKQANPSIPDLSAIEREVLGG
jgi:tetratricopeptide (TPR) repeat protein